MLKKYVDVKLSGSWIIVLGPLPARRELNITSVQGPERHRFQTVSFAAYRIPFSPNGHIFCNSIRSFPFYTCWRLETSWFKCVLHKVAKNISDFQFRKRVKTAQNWVVFYRNFLWFWKWLSAFYLLQVMLNDVIDTTSRNLHRCQLGRRESIWRFCDAIEIFFILAIFELRRLFFIKGLLKKMHPRRLR